MRDETPDLAQLPRPTRPIHSVGALAARYGLPVQTVRRALDRAVTRGLLPPLARSGNAWRVIPDDQLPAVGAALKLLGYPVVPPQEEQANG